MQFVIRPSRLPEDDPLNSTVRRLLNPYKHFNERVGDFLDRDWECWGFFYVDTDKKRYSNHDLLRDRDGRGFSVLQASSPTFCLSMEGVEATNSRDTEYNQAFAYRSPQTYEELIQFLEGGNETVRRF